MTQEELAKRIGANKSYISRIEKGITVPSVATFLSLIHIWCSERDGVPTGMEAYDFPVIRYAEVLLNYACLLYTSSNGEPVIGANVMVKGTTNGCMTDIDGNFSLKDAKGTLVIS